MSKVFFKLSQVKLYTSCFSEERKYEMDFKFK